MYQTNFNNDNYLLLNFMFEESIRFTQFSMRK